MSQQKINRDEMVNDILTDSIVKDIKDAAKSINSFSLFNPFQKTKWGEYKIYPLTIADNKRISQIMESIPDISKLDFKPEDKPEDINQKIDTAFNIIIEAQENVNDILADKVFTSEKDQPVNVNGLNVLDYQFTVFKLFSISNQGIGYRVNLSKSKDQEIKEVIENGKVDDDKKEKLMPIRIPLTEQMIYQIRNSYSCNQTEEVDFEGKKYTVNYDYKIRRMKYNLDRVVLDISTVEKKEDFDKWMSDLTYRISDNFSLVFKYVTIKEFLKLYFTIIKMQKLLEIAPTYKFNNRIISLLVDLYTELIKGIVKDGRVIDISNNIKIKEELRNFIGGFNTEKFLEISNIIFGNIFRLEIDITVKCGNKKITTDTWFDSGLSFFFNV